jgi:hypothetical protein
MYSEYVKIFQANVIDVNKFCLLSIHVKIIINKGTALPVVFYGRESWSPALKKEQFLEMTVFWDVAPCSVTEIGRRLRSGSCSPL